MRHVVIALVCLAACADDAPPPDDEIDCAQVTTDDDFVVGLNKLGADSVFGFTIMSGDPAPPIRGDNTWVVQIDANATPVDGATVRVTPFMPAHGHGAGKPVRVEPVVGVAGQYRLSPVNLWMPGVWETTIDVTSGADSDEVIFRFCIDS